MHPKRLLELRAERNLSQEWLAQQAGVSDFVIRKMERGQPVEREYAEKVVAVLGLTIEQVAGLKISDPLARRVNRSFVSGAVYRKREA